MMMKHRISRKMTARKTRMMNDSYLTSMLYRPQCIMRSVVLFLKQLSSRPDKVLGRNNFIYL